MSCCLQSVSSHSVHKIRRQPSVNQRGVYCRADGIVSKRNALLGSLAGITIQLPQAADAWDGPAKFLKSRQQANVAILIAPLDVSMKRLQAWQNITNRSLQDAQRLIGDSKDYTAALQLVRAASCNCYKFESFSTDSIDSKVSMMTQNMGLADPCTFRIVVKNVTVLMDDDDALKMQTKDVLNQVVNAYEMLDDLMISAGEFAADTETQSKVEPAIVKTIVLEEKLKEQIKLCIMQEA